MSLPFAMREAYRIGDTAASERIRAAAGRTATRFLIDGPEGIASHISDNHLDVLSHLGDSLMLEGVIASDVDPVISAAYRHGSLITAGTLAEVAMDQIVGTHIGAELRELSDRDLVDILNLTDAAARSTADRHHTENRQHVMEEVRASIPLLDEVNWAVEETMPETYLLDRRRGYIEGAAYYTTAMAELAIMSTQL